MKNRDIKRFLIACAIVLSSLFVIDRGVGVVYNYALKNLKNSTTDFGKENYSLNILTDIDILIIGSSRASHHFVPDVIHERIKEYCGCDTLSIYNAGIDGHFAAFNICCAHNILQRYVPKLLILELGPNLGVDKSDDRVIWQLAPFYDVAPCASEYIDSQNLRTRLQTKVNLFRFNSRILRIARAFMVGAKPNDGYEPLFGTMHSDRQEYSIETVTELDEALIAQLVNLFSYANELDANIVVTSSPRFRSKIDYNHLDSLCNQYDIPYINIYDTDTFNNHPELFKDWSHLNDDGARVYTSLFFEELVRRNLINDKTLTTCKSAMVE